MEKQAAYHSEYQFGEEVRLHEAERERTCTWCGTANVPMGVLGCLVWYRCRSCGAEYNNGED